METGLRVTAILNQFWRDDDTPDAVQALEIEGWMDVLDGLSQDEIRKAWARYQIEGPRSRAGRLAKPDAGAIRAIAIGARPIPKRIDPPPAPPRDRVTAEQAAAIIRATWGEAGMPTINKRHVATGGEA